MPPTSQSPDETRLRPDGRPPGGGSMKSVEVAEFVFDSHRFVKRLTRAGMDEHVAEVLADEQVALLTGNLATRTALADTGAETGLRKDLKDGSGTPERPEGHGNRPAEGPASHGDRPSGPPWERT